MYLDRVLQPHDVGVLEEHAVAEAEHGPGRDGLEPHDVEEGGVAIAVFVFVVMRNRFFSVRKGETRRQLCLLSHPPTHSIHSSIHPCTAGTPHTHALL